MQTLTAQTGTLFVVAAGNDGADGSVGSPASADAALAVGAVDRDDELADFSSRGPRVGDDGAQARHHRARRRHRRRPVRRRRHRRSGRGRATSPSPAPRWPPRTSPARPRSWPSSTPDWTAGQLKATLMASAKPHPEQTAYEQGAGRVDVARAIGQTGHQRPGQRLVRPDALAARRRRADHPRTVTYRNAGPTPISART